MGAGKGERTVIDVLERVAIEHPGTEAYVDGSERLTFLGLTERSAGVAAALADRGVARGDVVAIRLPTCIEYALVYLGALRLGAVATGVNPRLGRREVEGILARARPALIVTSDEDGAEDLRGELMGRGQIAALPAGDPGWRPVDLRPDDPVAIVWTSGTTGTPKGAVFDHRNLEALSYAAGELSRPFDRRLSPVPFAHVGYMTRLWDEIDNVMTSVIVPTPWSAAATLDLLESERITVGQGVPTQWELILRQPDLDRRDFSSLRLICHRCGSGSGVARLRPQAEVPLPRGGPLRHHGVLRDLRHPRQRPARGRRDDRGCSVPNGRGSHRRRRRPAASAR